jgi:hypothetical protein
MKVLPFEQSSRPARADAGRPAKESEKPDVDPPRKHAAPDDVGHDEPGYGHGV